MLEIHDLSVAYGASPLLDIPHLAFESGRSYAICGPNGTGKTTLLLCLAGLNLPDAGKITFDGAPIHGAGNPRIGIVFQRPALFSGTVESNIEYGLKCYGVAAAERRSRTLEIAKQFNLENHLQKSRRKLSGGEMQRVALARTMILSPDVFLLDEPFTHLDRENANILQQHINDIKSKCCVILTTHDKLSGLVIADIALGLDGGDLKLLSHANLFKGKSIQINGDYFLETAGGLRLQHSDIFLGNAVYYIEPSAISIAISAQPSSARNQIEGTITGILQDGGIIRLQIDAGVPLEAPITPHSYNDLDLKIGSRVYAIFKATAMRRLSASGHRL